MRKFGFLLVLALWLFAGVVSAQEGNTTYTVQRGDTITGIANAFDVDVDAILIANNLIDPNSISVGQVLVIPTEAVTIPRTHVVGAGETLNDIAIRYNTTIEALVATNNIVQPGNLAVGTVLTLPPVGGAATFPRTYRLDIGDTLRNVGERYGVTWQNLAAYNNISNPNYVQAGMVITIPPAGWTPPSPPATGGPVVVSPPPVTYVVQYGDTLLQIAQHFSVTLDSLRTTNNLMVGEAIFAGDVLVIPPTGGVVGQPVVPRQAINGVYTVQAGDTMFAIAASFGVNVYTLAQANGILNLNSIYAGQHLVVPGY